MVLIRLASNSPLEALVYSNAIYDYLSENPDITTPQTPVYSNTSKDRLPLITNSILSQIKNELPLFDAKPRRNREKQSRFEESQKKLKHWLKKLLELKQNHQGNAAFMN